LREPQFWKSKNYLSLSLLPIGLMYHLILMFKFILIVPKKTIKPVISIGSPVIGGGGKTPTVISITNLLLSNNYKSISIISRGYKGKELGPLEVQKYYSAEEVGDEALLLSMVTKTYVSKDKTKGIEFAIKNGSSILLLDDGYHNPSVKKDISILVIDGMVNLGNNMIFPSGPLKEGFKSQLKRCDAIIVINKKYIDKYLLEKIINSKKIIINTKINYFHKIKNLKNKKIIGLCGIGSPVKFFNALKNLRFKIIKKVIFSNHHLYSKKEVLSLIELLDNNPEYSMITTEKDYVRFNNNNDPLSKLRDRLNVLKMEIEILEEDKHMILDLIENKIQSYKN
jgi:tetraacyldisaccharide 4'-kinase